mmetsp:Transcript_20380/g.19356  ORF Transcript_20380/g.19356 Transcript_20380/m.19356 type:complete len:446 (-) Transcript_20380:931-2268(-)
MGDEYAEALSEGIKNTNKPVTAVNVGNNRLTDRGGVAILRAVKSEIEEIDMSFNPLLTIISYEKVCEILSWSQTKMRVLRLESNSLGDRFCEMIYKALDQSPTTRQLSLLNLRHNKITCTGAKSLAEMLQYNTSVSVLFLGWNKIAFRGATALAEVLRDNSNTKVQILDLAHNSIGSSLQKNYNHISQMSPKCGSPVDSKNEILISRNPFLQRQLKKQQDAIQHVSQTFKEMFQTNKTLVHLDLSYNGFRRQELAQMNEGLRENHQILGIHLMGNELATDSLGFLSLEGDQAPGTHNDCSLAHVVSRISENLETGTLKNTKRALNCSSNCWICEGWCQKLFSFSPMKYLMRDIDPYSAVYLHLDCDSFVGDLMERGPDGVYRIIRMVPPGAIKYHFSVEDENASKEKPTRKSSFRSDFSVMTPRSSALGARQSTIPASNIIETVA